MKKLFISVLILVQIFPSLVWAEDLPPLPKGPLVLTSVKREQLKPEYWINRLPNPDKVLKTPEELKKFNEEIHAMLPDTKDVFKIELTKSGKPVRKQLELEYNALKGRVLYDVKDQRVPKEFFESEIKPVMQRDKVPDRIKVGWGAATRATAVRALPTSVKLLEKKGDIEFDQLQFTLIKLWTPVAIYHRSSDGEWYYVQAPYSRGWVRAKDIAIFSGRDALKKMAKSSLFLVVTGESIPVYLDPEMKVRGPRASMGTILPLKEKTKKGYSISIPSRKEDGSVLLRNAFVSLKADVSKGFPAFTQRNIINQAFKLLGARYGWGGMYNGRDCSGFTHDVFLSLGVDMPRGSKEQAFIGTQVNHFTPYQDEAAKNAALRQGIPGITLMRMPHHQMLYLGELDGQFYAIHCTWAERISQDSDAKNRINQVVVTDLTLNGRSYLGSLYDRIISISEIN